MDNTTTTWGFGKMRWPSVGFPYPASTSLSPDKSLFPFPGSPLTPFSFRGRHGSQDGHGECPLEVLQQLWGKRHLFFVRFARLMEWLVTILFST